MGAQIRSTHDQVRPAFVPITGDLFFRYLSESTEPDESMGRDLGKAIGGVARGWNELPVIHVAIYEDNRRLWEASHDGVRRIDIDTFLAGIPVFVARIREDIRHAYPSLLNKAIAWIRTKEGLPYNHMFAADKKSFYCSELLVDAFRQGGADLLPETPLNFIDPSTGAFFPYWVDYYGKVNSEIPQGRPGSHPAHLSKAECLKIVHDYGALPRNTQRGARDTEMPPSL